MRKKKLVAKADQKSWPKQNVPTQPSLLDGAKVLNQSYSQRRGRQELVDRNQRGFEAVQAASAKAVETACVTSTQLSGNRFRRLLIALKSASTPSPYA